MLSRDITSNFWPSVQQPLGRKSSQNNKMVIYYDRSVLLLLLLVATIRTAGYSEILPQNENHPETPVPTKQIQNLVIELAIFYDEEFASRFDKNPKKIQKYWEVVIFDLHLRFQTLQSFSISFRVTSINLFEGPNKPVIVPLFDIGILTHGPSYSKVNVFVEQGLHGSVSQPKGSTEGKDQASALVSLQADPSPAEVLAWKIALVLGAPSDKDPALFSTCDRHLDENKLCCIMREHKLPRPKFFSKCTNVHLTKKIAQLISENKFCLDAATSQPNPINDSAKRFENPARLHGYTIAEQCQILLNDAKRVTASSNNDNCLHGECVDRFNNQNLLDFTPLEGTFCKTRGRCFRGLCIQPEFLLVNAATGKCVASETGMFGFNDKPVLQECSKIVTQTLDGPGIMRCCKHEELVLLIPYSVSSGISMKRLSTNLDNMKMMFCSKETSETCWETAVQIHRLSVTDGQDFVLEVGPGWYMKALEDGVSVDVTIDGTGNDKAMRWKLLEIVEGAVEPYKNSVRNCKPDLVYSGWSWLGTRTSKEL